MEEPQPGKLFIGGLNWETTSETLKACFSRRGRVVDCVIMRDRLTNRSRGFGFVTFEDPNVADQLARERHTQVDGRQVEVKRATPKDHLDTPVVTTPPSTGSSGSISRATMSALDSNGSSSVSSSSANRPLTAAAAVRVGLTGPSLSIASNGSSHSLAGSVGSNSAPNSPPVGPVSSSLPLSTSSAEYRTCKIFVGGLAWNTSEDDFRRHFEKHGSVTACQIMTDRDGKPRGFGYLTFDKEDAADRAVMLHHEINGRVVDVKKAIPKQMMESHSPHETDRRVNGEARSRAASLSAVGQVGSMSPSVAPQAGPSPPSSPVDPLEAHGSPSVRYAEMPLPPEEEPTRSDSWDGFGLGMSSVWSGNSNFASSLWSTHNGSGSWSSTSSWADLPSHQADRLAALGLDERPRAGSDPWISSSGKTTRTTDWSGEASQGNGGAWFRYPAAGGNLWTGPPTTSSTLFGGNQSAMWLRQ